MSLSSGRIYVPCHTQAGENCSQIDLFGENCSQYQSRPECHLAGRMPGDSEVQTSQKPRAQIHPHACLLPGLEGAGFPSTQSSVTSGPGSLCSPWSVRVPGAHRVLAGTAGPLGLVARHQHHAGGGQGCHSRSGEEGCQPAGFPWQLLMPLRIRWTKLLLFSYYCRFVCSQMQSQAQDTIIHCLCFEKPGQTLSVYC